MDIRQVAKHAKVSTATVSRVINGSAPVSEKTTERVRRSIEKLNFYPNTHARTLGSGKSRIYGLIISDITSPFFPELVKSFEDIAVEHGQEVIVANTNYNLKRMEMCVRRMLERKVDCVAVMTSEMESRFAEMFSDRKIPTVFLDTGTVGLHSSNIEVDYAGGIDLAADHLVALGHTRIAFLSNQSKLKSGQVRLEAFLNAMRRHQLPCDPALIRAGNSRPEAGRVALLDLIRLMHPPTAVMAVNDLPAIGALNAVYQAGLRVPDDISIVGFDDIELSSFTSPPLTTIRISREELGRRAFMALHAVSQRGEAGRTYKVDTTLVVRKSTAPPRQNSALENAG